MRAACDGMLPLSVSALDRVELASTLLGGADALRFRSPGSNLAIRSFSADNVLLLVLLALLCGQCCSRGDADTLVESMDPVICSDADVVTVDVEAEASVGNGRVWSAEEEALDEEARLGFFSDGLLGSEGAGGEWDGERGWWRR